VVVATGNDGEGGFQASAEPAVSRSDMSVGSVDNTYQLYRGYAIIIGPDGSTIYYIPGNRYGQWKSSVNLTIVVNSKLIVYVFMYDSILIKFRSKSNCK
jgi:hypothetical protein